MAIVKRWFATSSAGAADGTTHADRAALFSAGNWSTVITGFNFAGSDSLECLIEPGTYSCSQNLTSGLFANPPTAANHLFLFGADSSGNLLSPAAPNWTADQPVTWDSGLPVIATTGNISTINLATTTLRLLAFTASGHTSASLGIINACAAASWLSLTNSSSNSNAIGIMTSTTVCQNCVVSMTGTSYNTGVSATNAAIFDNIRLPGNASASSGNRRGLTVAGTSVVRRFTRICAYNHVGEGIIDTGTNVINLFSLSRFVCYNTAGVKLNTTASQTSTDLVNHGLVAGSSGWGIDAGAANVVLSTVRARDNTSGNFTAFGNYPTDLGNETSDIYANQAAADAAEFADSSTYDLRIKAGCPLAGLGYGISEQPASGSSSVKFNPGMTGGNQV